MQSLARPNSGSQAASLWHPLKLAGLLYVAGDISLFSGGVGHNNKLLVISGICGMLGNASLLAGGSGARKTNCPFMRRVSPYAERVSLMFYFLQGLAFALSGFLMYVPTVWSEVLSGALYSLGAFAGLYIGQRLWGLRPYCVTGLLWIASSFIGIYAGFVSNNEGVITASVCLTLAGLCVMGAHRAEFTETVLES